MIKSLRQSTLETLGLGTVLDIFRNGRLPENTNDLVDKVFGNPGNRGSLVISGANGIVGAGKLMQLGSRLQDFGIPVVALDFPSAPDGIGSQYQGLVAAFGKQKAEEIMTNVIQLSYDGKNLPSYLKNLNPKLLLEAIPEVLNLKKAHYNIFRENYPGIEIRSVTSGFPGSELGVGIAHPAFPHQINKVWEVVEDKPSDITKLLWSLGMIPVKVSDNWSFVLDVLFCGLTLAGLKYHDSTNMPFWKIDKFIRKLIGANPFRAHDVIGAKGANFLTWSCLNDLNKKYGNLFQPTENLTERKTSGQNWYPLNHLRPVIDWSLDEDESHELEVWIVGAMFQMTSILLKEERSHYSVINSIGEICAQFRNGVLSQIRSYGSDSAIELVAEFHKINPSSANSASFPETFKQINKTDWQQLYVNAEHDGKVGVITLGRESYNEDVNRELNRVIDWLKDEKIERVIITGDFHLTTQLVGADTSEFYPALNDEKEGFRISYEWSKTARRLNDEFATSVGFINGKRALGGMLELLLHCHYLVSIDSSEVGAPEVTLPVVPGMEFCHYPFRKAKSEDYHKIISLLLEGKNVKAKNTIGWLVDYAGSVKETVQICWKLANDGELMLPKRALSKERIKIISSDISEISKSENPSIIAARKAILDNIVESCASNYDEALQVQARHSAGFMISKHCRSGFVGSDFQKTMTV